MRSKSAKLVSSSGSPLTGPKSAGPTKPAVLVLTPSIDFDRKLTSSTYTPGAKYSGIGSPPSKKWRKHTLLRVRQCAKAMLYSDNIVLLIRAIHPPLWRSRIDQQLRRVDRCYHQVIPEVQRAHQGGTRDAELVVDLRSRLLQDRAHVRWVQ